MKRPELLAPAGNFEKMKSAILYGADAVYLAGQIFGMRAAADNFTIEELAEAVSKMNNLLGERYDLANPPAIGESAVNITPTLSGASVTLGAELKFYFVTDGTYDANLYRFTAGGRSLETQVSGNAIEVTTYAFALRDTLTYTVDGTDVAGSYNLKSYYDYMAGEGNGSDELMTLLERLWWYSESAEVYKNSIAG